MKILMVHPHDLWYDPWTIRMLELARNLVKTGHSVTLCHLPRKEKPAHEPIHHHEPGDPPVYDLLPRQQHIVANAKLLYRLAADSDIIHLQKCFASVSLPVLWISRLLKKPLHYDWDDNETAISRYVEKRFFSRFQLAVFEKWLPNFATTVSYSSQALKQLAMNDGFPKDRLFHIPVGADTNRFHPRNDSKEILKDYGLNPAKITILYLGQLEGAAHASRLIEAAPLVYSQTYNCQFLFAGGGEQLGALRKQAEESPVRSILKIAGYISYDKIPAIVGAADICVACFDNNDAAKAKSPLKIAEYLAAGKPIVASNVGEAPWMIENCGIVTEPENPIELAEGILSYTADPNRRRSDGLKARQRALDFFTWEKGTETLLKAYTRCLQQ